MTPADRGPAQAEPRRGRLSLEAELVETGGLLKPVCAADRQRALERMLAAKARVPPKPEQAMKTPEEQEGEAFDEVKAMRREYDQGRPR